jgi:hypothetical protein
MKEHRFRRDQSGGLFLNIVKKGYARDVDSRQRSTLVPAHRIGAATFVVVSAVPHAMGSSAR